MDAQMHEALRQILGKLDGLEDSLAKQGQGLRAVQQDVQAVKASQKELGERVGAVQHELGERIVAVQGQVEASQKELHNEVKAVQGELVLVSRHARAKQARLNGQATKQGVFLDVLHVVANAGFKQEVLVAFGLNKTTWNDESLWQTIINDKYTVKRDGKIYEGYTRLMMHCSWGRDSGVYRMLRLKANVHAENEQGWTALNLASFKGRKDAVRALLKAGSKVNHVDKGGCSSLFNAAQEGFFEIVKILASAGASLNQAKTTNGATPMFMAVQENHVEVVKFLASAGASLDKATTTDGSTPLIVAAFLANVEVVRVLLSADANVHHVNNYGNTALDYAKLRKKMLKEDDEKGRRKFDEVIALLEQKIAATAAPKPEAEAEASKGKGKG